MTFETELSQLLICYLNFRGVLVGIQGGFHNQSRLGCCTRNQIDYYFQADQGPRTPVFGDEAEEAMFHLIPFARAGWEVTDQQPDTQFVG